MAGDIVGRAYIEISPLTSRFQQQLTSSLQQVHAGGGFQVPVSANAQGFQQSLTRAIPRGGMILPVHADTKALTDGITAALSKLARTGLMIAGIGSIFGMVISHLKGAIYEYNNQIQQARIGLETLLGSAQEADDLIEGLKVFARETPFQFKDLVTNTQTLIAMGTEAKDVIPTLTAVGDALSGLGRMSSMPRILFDLGQIRATGRLTGRELMNMSMQGIPVLKYLADATGRSMAELREQMARGTRAANGMMIDSATAISAILTGMENQFGGLMKRQMSTAAGAISNWKDSEQQLLGAIGEPFFNKIISLTIGVSKVANEMSQAFSEAGKQGKSGLTAVREVFIDLFPESAHQTINSILDNLAKSIGLLGRTIKIVVDEGKKWGTLLAGILLPVFRGILNVITPLNSFITKHTTLVKDLVAVYVAFMVVGKISALLGVLGGHYNAMLGRVVSLTTATKYDTIARQENANAMVRQALAMGQVGTGIGGTGIPGVVAGSGRTLPNPEVAALSNPAYGVRATGGMYDAAPVGRLGLAVDKLKLAFGNARGASILMAGALEMVKSKTGPLSGAVGILQGALAGFALTGNPLGLALGALGGVLLMVKNRFEQTSAAAKSFAAAVKAEVLPEIEAYNKALGNQFGTDQMGMPGQTTQAIKDYQAAVADRNRLNDERNRLINQGEGAVDKIDPFDPRANVFGRVNTAGTDNFQSIDNQFAHAQEKVDQLGESFGPNGMMGGFLQNFATTMSGANGGNIEGLKKLGMDDKTFNAITNPAYKEGGFTVPAQVKGYNQLFAELQSGKITTDDYAAAVKFLNEHQLDNAAATKAALAPQQLLATAVAASAKAAKDAAKAFNDLYEIDKMVADSHEALLGTFNATADVVATGSKNVRDFAVAAKGLGTELESAGAAAYASVLSVAGATKEMANAGMRSAQLDVIDNFVSMWSAAGLTKEQIDQVLESLGLLNQYHDLTVNIAADASAFWDVFNLVMAAIGVGAEAWGAADSGSLSSLAGGNSPANPFDTMRKKIMGITTPALNEITGKPDKTKTGGGSSGPSAADIAAKAATALEGASHAFYDTIVAAAKAFQDHIKEIMGNPAERLQQSQSVGIGRMIRNTDMRTAAISDWSTGLAKLRQEGLSQMAIDQLGLAKGPEMDRQVKRLLRASPDEITKLNASLTSEQAAAAAAAWKEQGNTIAKAITDSLGKFFADSGLAPDGTTGISITNQFTGGVVDPDALALAIINKLGGKVKL